MGSTPARRWIDVPGYEKRDAWVGLEPARGHIPWDFKSQIFEEGARLARYHGVGGQVWKGQAQ
jgi:hypothetical protein